MIAIDIKENLSKYSNAVVVDLTTIDGRNAFRKLSPYYPHGGILIPNTPNQTLNSVSEVWQKLCVKGEDDSYGIKGEIKFRKGLNINDYWTYAEARQEIFIPLYCWVLENKAFGIIEWIREQSKRYAIIIIDKSINCDIKNVDKPLSCAFLLKAYIEGNKPYENAIEEVTECSYILVGQRDFLYKKKKVIPQKIANVYIGAQRILDFKK